MNMNMYSLLLAVLSLIGCVSSRHLYTQSQQSLNNNSLSTAVEPKLFSMFTIVNFENSPCNVSDTESGVCVPKKDCSKSGGTPGRACAQGFGVCCLHTATCDPTGGYTQTNNTYFRNPGYGNSYSTPRSCTYRVRKCSDEICFLRLDFEEFEIHQPVMDRRVWKDMTQCRTDSFVVLGGTKGSSRYICGYNTGQHMYYDMGPTTEEVEINMLIGKADFERKWSIRLSQIPCGQPYTPWQGCVQFFTENSGILKSFNWRTSFADSYHLGRQKQAMCIRPNEGFCLIHYYENPEAPPGESLGIFIDDEYDTEGHVDPDHCQHDFVVIPNSLDTNNPPLRGDRYCGVSIWRLDEDPIPLDATKYQQRLPIRGTSRPFLVTFNSNPGETRHEAEDGINVSRGFTLEYHQTPC